MDTGLERAQPNDTPAQLSMKLNKIITYLKRIKFIQLRDGQRFYFVDIDNVNNGSIDDDGNLRLKGSVYENQSTV